MKQHAKSTKKGKNTIHPIHGPYGIVYEDEEKVETVSDTMENESRLNELEDDDDDEHSVAVENREIKHGAPTCSGIKAASLKELQAIISRLKLKKRPIYHKCSYQKLPKESLVSLPKNCIRFYLFSEAWKLATVITLTKLGKNDTFTQNYRLIGLLPFLSKVVERVILIRLKSETDSSVPHYPILSIGCALKAFPNLQKKLSLL